MNKKNAFPKFFRFIAEVSGLLRKHFRNISETFPKFPKLIRLNNSILQKIDLCKFPNHFRIISEVEQRDSLEKKLKYLGDNIDKCVMISNWANWAAIGQIAQRSRNNHANRAMRKLCPNCVRIVSEISEFFLE